MPEVDVRLRSQAARFSSLTRALSADLEPAEVIDIVVTYGMAGLDAESGLLALIRGEWVVPICAVNTLVDAGALPLALDLPIAVAARSASAVWVHSRAEASSTFPDLLVGNSLLAQAWAALPLSGDGDTFGVLQISFATPQRFSEADRLFLQALADVTALVLRSRKHPLVDFAGVVSDRPELGSVGRRAPLRVEQLPEAVDGVNTTNALSPRRLSRSRRRRPKSLRNDSGVFPATTAGSSWRMQA